MCATIRENGLLTQVAVNGGVDSHRIWQSGQPESWGSPATLHRLTGDSTTKTFQVFSITSKARMNNNNPVI
jgi:hypothetical protein